MNPIETLLYIIKKNNPAQFAIIVVHFRDELPEYVNTLCNRGTFKVKGCW